MIRGLLVILVQLLLTPPLAVVAIAAHLLRPDAEPIPRVGRAWARILLRVAGVEVVVDRGDIPLRSRPAVVVSNHCSFIDVYVAAHVLPQPIRFVAKASLFRIPLFGQAMRAAGVIPLERAGKQTDIDRLQALQKDLARGAVVVFFPEGTRSTDGRLRRFKKGAFVTALRAGVPVVPMLLAGAHRIQPAGSIRIRPAVVRVTFLDPVSVEGLVFDDRDLLVAKVHELFVASLPAEQRPREPRAAGADE
jgi:1-acyl-sn-glycerol-3-phosphate acyltransferase